MSKADETPGAGHNSAGAADLLQSYVKRYEKRDEDRQEAADDLKEILAEAKGAGFDVKVLRKVLARRKRERDEVEAEDEMISLYEGQIGAFG
jgi:uncharacterized protein (UPF0335 family)